MYLGPKAHFHDSIRYIYRTGLNWTSCYLYQIYISVSWKHKQKQLQQQEKKNNKHLSFRTYYVSEMMMGAFNSPVIPHNDQIYKEETDIYWGLINVAQGDSGKCFPASLSTFFGCGHLHSYSLSYQTGVELCG